MFREPVNPCFELDEADQARCLLKLVVAACVPDAEPTLASVLMEGQNETFAAKESLGLIYTSSAKALLDFDDFGATGIAPLRNRSTGKDTTDQGLEYVFEDKFRRNQGAVNDAIVAGCCSVQLAGFMSAQRLLPQTGSSSDSAEAPVVDHFGALAVATTEPVRSMEQPCVMAPLTRTKKKAKCAISRRDLTRPSVLQISRRNAI